MRDVADRAGVSLKTVSRVINAEAGVTPATAERVTAAIAELGFERNDLAASLRHGRSSHTLGLVIEDVANPFYSVIAQAVEAVARERGFLLITTSAGEDAERERELVAALLRRRVDALLIVPAGPDHRYLASSTRAVFLDRPPLGIDADTVLLDDVGGARSAVEHLIAHGHTRIACVADDAHLYTMRERITGYHDALQAAGIQPDPALLLTGSSDVATAQDSVAACSRSPTARPRSSPPTTATRSVRSTRSATSPTRPRSWASTTSSSPTCSAPPSFVPTRGSSASRPPRSRSPASTATSARRAR